MLPRPLTEGGGGGGRDGGAEGGATGFGDAAPAALPVPADAATPGFGAATVAPLVPTSTEAVAVRPKRIAPRLSASLPRALPAGPRPKEPTNDTPRSQAYSGLSSSMSMFQLARA